MRHDASIPTGLHSGAVSDVKDALGSFWSILFRDQELVDATVSARVLSACQAYIDEMEALSLRDHSGMPVFHREHWHPLLVRLSERNTGCGLVVGMDGGPKVGPQPSGSVFSAGEVFVVGGNAEFSKVNTYPIDSSVKGRLMSVGTCMCDSISNPEHVLVPGRDFDLRGDVLLIRKENDPFTAGGYRIVEDGDDMIAVMWMCDAEFDREHVGDFLAYPLGFDVKSTRSAAVILSALWDVVVYGMTPLHLNLLLGALFDVPTVRRETTVEYVEDDGTHVTVATGDSVYRFESSRKSPEVVAGSRLPAGSFLTDEIEVYHGLSDSEFRGLVSSGKITSITLPPGSVAGVDVPVELANITSRLELGDSGGYEWFKLNGADRMDSPFWSSVIGRTTADARVSMCSALAAGGSTVNPLLALGYTVMANTVLVRTRRPMSSDPCAQSAFGMIGKLMQPSGSILFDHVVSASASSFSPRAMSSERRVFDGGHDSDVAMDDSVSYSMAASESARSEMPEAADSVAVRFIPDAATEV